jgi:hypothetical protein
MNIIKAADSRALGEHEADQEHEPEVSQQDAHNALVSAKLGDGVELTTISSRVKVGRFLAGQMGGHIVSQGVWYQAILEKAATKLSKDLDSSSDAAQNVATAGAIKDIAVAAAQMAAVQLKATEIVAHRGKKKMKQGNAPQQTINAPGAQILIGGITPPNAVASSQGKP